MLVEFYNFFETVIFIIKFFFSSIRNNSGKMYAILEGTFIYFCPRISNDY